MIIDCIQTYLLFLIALTLADPKFGGGLTAISFLACLIAGVVGFFVVVMS